MYDKPNCNAWHPDEDALLISIYEAAPYRSRLTALRIAWREGRFPGRSETAVTSRVGKLCQENRLSRSQYEPSSGIEPEPKMSPHLPVLEKWAYRDHKQYIPLPLARPAWFDEPDLRTRLVARR